MENNNKFLPSSDWDAFILKIQREVFKMESVREAAKEIRICESSLRKFLYGGSTSPSWLTRVKFEKWIKTKEK